MPALSAGFGVLSSGNPPAHGASPRRPSELLCPGGPVTAQNRPENQLCAKRSFGGPCFLF
eukprot:scaffold6057_cov112-Isochrysis_galbana.AAC.7